MASVLIPNQQFNDKRYVQSSKGQTKVQLESEDTIFGDGVLVTESDTRRRKIGDGVTPYSKLPYLLEGFISTQEPDAAYGKDGDVWIKLPAQA